VEYQYVSTAATNSTTPPTTKIRCGMPTSMIEITLDTARSAMVSARNLRRVDGIGDWRIAHT
jgi:hypothetical protein